MKYIAITVVKIRGKYFSPGGQLPDDIGAEHVKQLLAVGDIAAIEIVESDAEREAREQAEREQAEREEAERNTHTTTKRSGDQEGATADRVDAQDTASASVEPTGAAAEGESAAAEGPGRSVQDSSQQLVGSDDASRYETRDSQDAESGSQEGAGAAAEDAAAPKSERSASGKKKSAGKK